MNSPVCELAHAHATGVCGHDTTPISRQETSDTPGWGCRSFGADDGSRPTLRRRPGRRKNVPPVRFFTPLPFDSLSIPKGKPPSRAAFLLERMMGVDLRCGGGRVAGKTCHRHVFLHRSRSTPFSFSKRKNRPHRAVFSFGADDGSRTHLIGLGSRSSTDELHPRVDDTIPQLSGKFKSGTGIFSALL